MEKDNCVNNEEKMCSSLHSRDDRFVDEITKKKIQDHIKDPNSKITDQDIANVNTDIFKTPLPEEEHQKNDDKADDKLPPKAGLPWDVLE